MCRLCQEEYKKTTCPYCRTINYPSREASALIRKFILDTSPTLQLIIITLQGKAMVISIKQLDTILNLKKMIHEKDHLPIEQQRLTYASKNLEDNKTLKYYQLQNNSSVHCLGRLLGGV
jgi:hypothetical protein